MATVQELIEGFTTNVSEGIPSTLRYDGERITLSTEGNGFEGMARVEKAKEER